MFKMWPAFRSRAARKTGVSKRTSKLVVERLEERALLNSAPVLDPIPDQTMTAGQKRLVVPFTASDADGDRLRATVLAQLPPSLNYILDQQYGLGAVKNYDYNHLGAKEKYLTGADGLYFLLPTGDLYKLNTTIADSTLVASPGVDAYVNPKLLWHAAPPPNAPVNVNIKNGVLSLELKKGFTGTFLVGMRVSDGQASTVQNFAVTVTPPQVTSDKPDYGPGETATLTATGYRPGEPVKFRVLHTDGNNSGVGHKAWVVKDGSAEDLDGKMDGNVTTTWHVDPDDSLGATFLVSALGLSSKLRATKTFTDAGLQDQLQQLQNVVDQWSNGSINNVNSHYSEGRSVAYRYEMTGIPGGGNTVVRLTLHYQFTTNGTDRAFDFLTNFNKTEGTSIAAAGGIFGGTPLSTLTTGSSTTSVQIPDDATVPFDNAVSPQFLTIYGDFTGAATVSSVVASGDDKLLTLSIPVANGGQIALFWGGHLALSSDWPGGGSASISGAPFHQNLEGFVDEDGDNTKDGNEKSVSTGDRSVQSIFPPDLGITKTFSVPGGTADVAGETITYTITVKNNGDEPLTNVVVTDPMASSNPIGTIASLAVGASQSFTFTYNVTQTDLNTNGGGDGDIDNTATAACDQVDPRTASAAVPITYNPSISISKAFNIANDADQTIDSPTDDVTYTVTITNTGNVTLTNVAVNDPLA